GLPAHAGHHPDDHDLRDPREPDRGSSLQQARPAHWARWRSNGKVTAVATAARRRQMNLPAPLANTVEFLRTMSRKPVGLVGLFGVLFFLFLAYVAPFFVPLQDQVDVTAIYAKPSFVHPLGTDFQGRDVLNQIVYGGGDIITTAILAALFSTLIAITFGSISASCTSSSARCSRTCGAISSSTSSSR